MIHLDLRHDMSFFLSNKPQIASFFATLDWSKTVFDTSQKRFNPILTLSSQILNKYVGFYYVNLLVFSKFLVDLLRCFELL